MDPEQTPAPLARQRYARQRHVFLTERHYYLVRRLARATDALRAHVVTMARLLDEAPRGAKGAR